MIIVHKDFLLRQWIERIEQFLPNAKVGKIQGKIIDVEDKDIVIGMLQSISMKDYPDDVFNSFGFVIYDECHHLGAEIFHKSMKKIAKKRLKKLDINESLSYISKTFRDQTWSKPYGYDDFLKNQNQVIDDDITPPTPRGGTGGY